MKYRRFRRYRKNYRGYKKSKYNKYKNYRWNKVKAKKRIIRKRQAFISTGAEKKEIYSELSVNMGSNAIGVSTLIINKKDKYVSAGPLAYNGSAFLAFTPEMFLDSITQGVEDSQRVGQSIYLRYFCVKLHISTLQSYRMGNGGNATIEDNRWRVTIAYPKKDITATVWDKNMFAPFTSMTSAQYIYPDEQTTNYPKIMDNATIPIDLAKWKVLSDKVKHIKMDTEFNGTMTLNFKIKLFKQLKYLFDGEELENSARTSRFPYIFISPSTAALTVNNVIYYPFYIRGSTILTYTDA